MTRRIHTIVLLAACAASLGMSGTGCPIELAAMLRPPPAIIPAGNPANTLLRTFSVDLRNYPETETITWDFGDGSVRAGLPVSQGRTISHSYAAGGTYIVAVHLFSGKDLINQRSAARLAGSSLPVTVIGPNANPIAAISIFDVSDDTGSVRPLSRRFSAANSRDPDGTLVEFLWDFGDGATATGISVVHDYERGGRFSVRLVVTDDRGGQGTANRTLLLNSLPGAQFTFQVDPNDRLTVHFDGSASTDADANIASFTWNFGDNSPTASGPIVSHTYAVPDTYTVRLTVTDDLGASISTTQSVRVTGTAPFIRSITPDFGEVDTALDNVNISGENFVDGATVILRRGTTIVNGTLVLVARPDAILVNFNLANINPGDYDVVVANPGQNPVTLANGFRVVTPNHVRLTTSMGDMVLELVPDAPVTTQNFLQYVQDKFYDGTIFHRVVPNFVVQGGGQLPDGSTPPGLRPPIVNEFSPSRSNVRATVAMAKVGGNPDSATSQFFVNLADNSGNLDNQNGGFTVFARVISGMNVADAIAAVPLNGERPVTDVVLIRARRE